MKKLKAKKLEDSMVFTPPKSLKIKTSQVFYAFEGSNGYLQLTLEVLNVNAKR